MSAHRLHALDIPPAAEPRPSPEVNEAPAWRDTLRVFAIVMVVVAALATMAATAFLAPPERATPIPQPSITSAPLPALDDDRARLAIQQRLELFRAGYEAAVQNGCAVRPLLLPPVGPRS